MTVWIEPRTTPSNIGFSQRSIARALAKGLTFRPLAVTAKDTLDWNKTRPAEELKKLANGEVGGISAEKEAEVLAAWKARAKTP
jgi:2'-hydroxyisoflavone reductase